MAKFELFRHDDGFLARGSVVKYITFSEDGDSVIYDDIAVGRHMIVDPSPEFTWTTSQIVEIFEKKDTHIVFKTENSRYTLYIYDKI